MDPEFFHGHLIDVHGNRVRMVLHDEHEHRWGLCQGCVEHDTVVVRSCPLETLSLSKPWLEFDTVGVAITGRRVGGLCYCSVGLIPFALYDQAYSSSTQPAT